VSKSKSKDKKRSAAPKAQEAEASTTTATDVPALFARFQRELEEACGSEGEAMDYAFANLRRAEFCASRAVRGR
jgi:hypothetical protein